MIVKFTVAVIKLYKVLITPILKVLFGYGCRYPISCSEYAANMISTKGIIKGGKLAIKRVISCRPGVNPDMMKA